MTNQNILSSVEDLKRFIQANPNSMINIEFDNSNEPSINMMGDRQHERKENER